MRRFALVQWKAGADKGKFSEVSTDAVRNYNDEDFDKDGNPIEEGQAEAIVEWRQGKKQKQGWSLHAGAVLYVHTVITQVRSVIPSAVVTTSDTLSLVSNTLGSGHYPSSVSDTLGSGHHQ
ncbi:hypothetical protein EOD39_9580 [Acipenser ruthenus]|uniref:Uncharacterized protein n=1 Tax=Acipenser ruthenus TaxID=7906 RepID=A0A662YUU3_ACIRT|nr:hypothetical protein EOD39_9580 [Acipenser ruthenus]